jgi:hypothetical protein
MEDGMLVYVAGPYRGDVDRNIEQARQVAIALWEAGHTAICPHLNTAHFEQDCCVPDQTYLSGDLDILSRCDAIVMTPDWEGSVGASAERQYAQQLRIPVYVFPDLPAIHPTERTRPQQVKAFRETVAQMYRVHLDKNADYSPANILGPGEIGLATRLWDKITRMMNLIGFRIEIASSSFEQPRAPRCEAIDDTYIDLAVYGVIGLLLRRGVWGK